jgi:lysine-N-methylase
MLLVPDYYKKFKCIADKCTDSCCIGWEIDVDEVTLAKYREMGDDKILSNVLIDADIPYIRLTADERCPFLDDGGLCKIISALGEDYIPDICKNHPRYINDLSPYTECGLGLACPEAARIILEISEKPNIEFWDKSPTFSLDIAELWDVAPTNDDKSRSIKEKSPTKSKNALFSLRERLFSFIFDKEKSVLDIAAGLFCYDNTVSDSVFDMQTGDFSHFPEINTADFGEIFPLIPCLHQAIDSLELQSEDYRRSFAEPSLKLLRERLASSGDSVRALLYYFLHRYFLSEAEDLNMDMRLSLVLTLLFLCLLHTDKFDGNGMRDAAVAFSKNVEYSTENIDIILGILAEL